MVNIKEIHRELVVNHFVKYDIDEELVLIDRQYAEAVVVVLMKISAMEDETKVVALETIKIQMFYGDVEEWCSFRKMFNRCVHMSKHPPGEKQVNLKTHVRISENYIKSSNYGKHYKAACEILIQWFVTK